MVVLALLIQASSSLLFAQENKETSWGTFDLKISDFSFSTSLDDSVFFVGNLLEYEKDDFSAFVNPAFDLLYGLSQKNNLQYGLGFNGHLKYKKWTASATFLGKNGNYLPYQEEFIRKWKVLPSMGMTRGLSNFYASYKEAHINFKPNNIFNFELGYGRNFIGHGHRSLLLSDFSSSSPYLKIQTSIWNLKYTNLFSIYDNIFNVEGARELYQQKYVATHFLEWNIGDRVSLGLFESVVWERDQGNYHRGFDVNYLNPIIFYRPVEYSIGSPDNMILGAQLAVKLTQHHQIYGQLVFDEFLLDELKADFQYFIMSNKDIQHGWWANKYAIQAGWKATSLFGIPTIFARLEANLVRPFSYAHSYPTQAYTHNNMSLAHPLGASFLEGVSELSYTKGRWMVNLQYNISKQGSASSVLTNTGNNLQLSTNTRANTYGNYIAQGGTFKTKYLKTSTSYLLKKEWKAALELGFIYRESGQGHNFRADKMAYLRFRTNLFKQHFDF